MSLSQVFKAYDIRGIYPEPLDEALTRRIGCAIGRFMKSQLSGQQSNDPMMQHVVVGRDMRKSSPKLADALFEGLRSAPINVIDVGMVDTSFIYFAVNHLGCAGGIMITASHNPPNYNGFKISGMGARPIGGDTGLDEIKRIAATLDPEKFEPTGRIEQRDLWDAYVEHVGRFLELKRPLKVVIDASNGMAAAFIPRIFGNVPDLEIIPINFEVTGEFVHEPNPLVAENMRQTQEGVREHGADLGVCFDGDADRCMITDEKGNLVGCDVLGGVMAEYFLNYHAGSAIVYDLRSTKALPEAIEAAGGKPVRSRVGHVFMKKVLRESGGVFGAELSGHMYYRDNFSTDSGAITFATVLSILSSGDKPISALLAPMQKYPQSGEINFKVEDKDGMIEEFRQIYAGRAEIDDLDGITIDAMASEGWWLNLRKSNTEPLLRLNMEACDQATLDRMYDEVKQRLGEPAEGH